ncbi:MAG: hypothetical protein AAGC88_00610 [Bacteroidota bacterium]
MFILLRHLSWTTVLILIAVITTSAQPEPVFLGDINQEEDGSNPRNFIVVDSYAYFIASSGIGYEVWRTDGTEEGTVPLTWFNDRFEDTDWKYLIGYDRFRFIVQTVDGIYVTNGLESSLQKISDVGVEAEVYVVGDLIFWDEPDQASSSELVFASSGLTASTRLILEVNALNRVIDLDETALISVIDKDGNPITIKYDGSSQSFTTFVEADVLAADEADDLYYFTAIEHAQGQFQLYSKNKFTDQVDQLTSFNDTLIADYNNHETSAIALGGAVFFTKLVERNGQIEQTPELHRYQAGQVELVGNQQERGFEPVFIYSTFSGVLMLDRNNLYQVSADGSQTVLHNDRWILDGYSSVYHVWDDNRIHYFTGFPGNTNLVVSDGSPFGTHVVSINSAIGRVALEVGMTNV